LNSTGSRSGFSSDAMLVYISLYTEMTSTLALLGVGAVDGGFCAMSTGKPIKKRKTYFNMGELRIKLKKRSLCLTRAAQK
jgi:hypothetical protein